VDLRDLQLKALKLLIRPLISPQLWLISALMAPLPHGAEASPPPAQLDEGLERASAAPEEPLWLPAERREAWRTLLKGPNEGRPLIALHYGDSHTQGGFLSRALRDELSGAPQPEALQEPSPGFVHQGHPHAWGGEVELSGHWQRQNWIYGADRGLFGPLGISFVTQDRDAELNLSLDNPPLQSAQVTLFYAEEPGRLGFCLRVLPDPDQEQRAERRQSKLSEALSRYQSLLYPSPPPEPLDGRAEPASSAEAELEADLARGQSASELSSNPTQAPLAAGVESSAPTAGEQPPEAQGLHDQSPELAALLSERGLCVEASAEKPSPGEAQQALKQLTVQLPRRHLLRLSTLKGSQVTDRGVKAWRKARKRARRRGRQRRRGRETSNLRPDLIYPDRPRLRVLGFHVRYPESVIEWSVLGVSGARVKSAARRHEGAIEALAQLSQAQLFVLWFGTNSAASESVNLESYEQQYRDLIKTLKAGAPEAQCLLITAPDFGRRPARCYLNSKELRVLKRKRKNAWARRLLAEHREARVCAPESLLNHKRRGRYRYPFPNVKNEREWEAYQEECRYHTPALIGQLTELQRRIARDEGCALYDSLKAMGGEGSMKRWACAEPRWAQLDLVHLSSAGYEALGAHIARSLRYELGLDELAPPPLRPPGESSSEARPAPAE